MEDDSIAMFCPFESEPDGVSRMRSSTSAASSLMFSAERIYNALAMSLTKTPPPASVCLKLEGDPARIAVVTLIGLAMLESGLVSTGNGVCVNLVLILARADWGVARDAMSGVGLAVQKTLDAGYCVVQLSELAIAIESPS
jgi:hypothetical protein